MKKIIYILIFTCIAVSLQSQSIIQLTVDQPSKLVVDAGLDTSINVGDSVKLGGDPTVTGGTSPFAYEWSPDDGLSDPNIANPMAFPDNTTNYSLTVTDGNGCTANSDIQLDVTSSSIGNANSDIKFNIYPNPNKGRFNFVVEGKEYQEFTMSVTNNVGKIVYKKKVKMTGNNFESRVDLSECSKGIYIFMLNGKNVNIINKLVIN